jgi:hypothetical protein
MAKLYEVVDFGWHDGMPEDSTRYRLLGTRTLFGLLKLPLL